MKDKENNPHRLGSLQLYASAIPSHASLKCRNTVMYKFNLFVNIKSLITPGFERDTSNWGIPKEETRNWALRGMRLPTGKFTFYIYFLLSFQNVM